LKALKNQISGNHELFKDYQDFLNKFSEIWWQALGLDLEMTQLSNDEADSLNQYLSANRFILECKASAVHVSKDTWETIENRMLTVWEEG